MTPMPLRGDAARYASGAARAEAAGARALRTVRAFVFARKRRYGMRNALIYADIHAYARVRA